MQIWACSYCRSTLAFYEALAKELGQPLRICLAQSGMGHRAAIGFNPDEFSHLNIVDVSTSSSLALKLLSELEEEPQLFGVYQALPHIGKVIKEAIRRGCKVGIASEAPCNMSPPGFARIARKVYLQYLARRRFSNLISGAQFIINWSGDAASSLEAIGWARRKIIPCGYFSPPLDGSHFVQRHLSHLNPLHILCTGSMTWHRGPDILMQALITLKSWGITFRATFTGSGPLEESLRRTAKENDLACDFKGSVPMSELIELYQTCSLFVAPGRAEPWGMRVNDALNCGAPIVISRNMGASKLVFDYGFGRTFHGSDPVDLAWQIRCLVSDKSQYLVACDNLSRFHQEILPDHAAVRVANILRSEYGNWIEGIKT